MVKDPASELAGAPMDSGFFGHPRGLRTLFFTEMWERFSYYGMRAILILFMTAAVVDGGLGFGADKAGPIYAMYTSLVYLATVPGGWLADNFLGQRRSVLWGGIVIMIGHILLAIHGLTTFFAGLGCIVIGTGLLKPNISVIVGQLYRSEDQRRDSGFSIFYMGINIGAFSAPLVCGWLAQSDSFKGVLEGWGIDPARSWHWGFAAAAVGMFFGLVQYLLTGRDLGDAGLHPVKPASPQVAARHKRTLGIGAAATVIAVVALLWLDSRATHLDTIRWESTAGGLVVRGTRADDREQVVPLADGAPIGVGGLDRHLGEEGAGDLRAQVLREEVAAGTADGELEEEFLRVPDPTAVAALEQQFPQKDEAYEEALEGVPELRIGAVSYASQDGVLTITGHTLAEPDAPVRDVPLASVPVADLAADAKPDLEKHVAALLTPIGKDVLAQAIEAGRASGDLAGQDIKVGGLNTNNIKNGFTVLLLVIVVGFFAKLFLAGDWTRNERARLVTIFVLFCGAAVFWGLFEQAGSTLTLFADRSTNNSIFGLRFPSSWWQSLNALMIIALAPVFAWLWIAMGKRNPSYPTKFAFGLLFAAAGFALLIGGAKLSEGGTLVSPMWLFGVYLLHTIGELCLSPVGLSSMTKLAPARVVSLMMGVWFLAASVGNFMAGSVAGYYEDFELPAILGVVAAAGGVMSLVMFMLVLPIKRMMARSEEPERLTHGPEG